MTTLIFDVLFLLFLMPIWFKINKSLYEYAESAHEDHQVLNEEIELEDQEKR